MVIGDVRLRRGPNTGLEWRRVGNFQRNHSHAEALRPLRPRPLGDAMNAARHDSGPDIKTAPRTVLVVEDEVLIRLATAEYLRECGFTVYEAGNVDEAQAIFAAALPVDIVFSDVQMPSELDGFGLARWVRATHPGVPIILTSGVARLAADAADLCDQAPFVEKPYDHRAIAECIRVLLATRESAGER